MNYYNEIKDKLIKCEIYDRVKDYSKERNRVEVYFEIGRLLSEEVRNMVKILLNNIQKN